MPDVRLPLSGAVVQSISPWTAWFSPFNNQFGTVTINLGKSADPATEAEVIADVASYGRQLGRVEDLLGVLVDRLSGLSLTPKETQAIAAFRELVADIEAVKTRHAARRGPAVSAS